jgi:DeoR family fructose operon transcriptional repressor
VFAEERKQQIMAILQRTPAVRVTELGRSLKVSVASVRAVTNQLATFEPSLAAKEDRYRSEKAAIAAMAARLVRPGDTVFLDSGSTTRAIALQLRERRGLTVVTNALNIGWELASSSVDLILTGGQVRRGILSQVGPLAERALASFRVDKLFLAANGIDLDKGVTTPNLAEAQTKRAMVESAGEVILVADHSKFGRVTFSHICDLDRVHTIITDDALPRRLAAAMQKRGVKLHLVAVRRPAETPMQRKRRA